MDLTIRLEEKGDYGIVEALTRAAFWKDENASRSGMGCVEHYLAHALRESPVFLPELDFVAVAEGEIVGNIMFSRAFVERHDGGIHRVLNFGPLSVLPEHQNKGIGGALLRHSLKKAARLGHGSVIIFGHPDYYPRFGFREAREFGIATSEGKNFPAFMAMELIHGDLEGVAGRFHESLSIMIDQEKARAFEASFATAGQ